MKRIVAVGLTLPALAVATSAGAQDDPPDREEDRIRIGPAFGVTMAGESNLTAAIGILTDGYAYTYATAASLMRPVIGLRIEKASKKADHKRTIIEIQYTQFGSRIGPFNISKHMISVPILHQWDLGRYEPITPHFELGVQPSFRLATRATSRFVAYGSYIADYWNGYDLLRQPFDVGMTGGFGVSFPLENTRASLDLRLYHGLMPKNSPFGLVLNRQVGVFGGITF